MAKLSFNMEIGEAFQQLENASPAQLDRIVNRALREGGKIFDQRIRPETPKLTGRLRSSLGFVVEEGVLTVGFLFDRMGGEGASPVEYAAYVEFGTRYMEPRDFFFATIEASVPAAMEEIEFTVAEGLSKVLSNQLTGF